MPEIGGWYLGSRPPLGIPFTLNRQSSQAAGLIAWWPTNQPTATHRLVDVVGGCDLTVSTPGTVNRLVVPEVGGGPDFTRVAGSQMSGNNAAHLAGNFLMTGAAWIWPRTLGYNTVIFAHVWGGRGWQLWIKDVRVLALFMENKGDQTASTQLTEGQLYHVAFTFNNNTRDLKFYINGRPDWSGQHWTTFNALQPTDYFFLSNYSWWDGGIYDVRVYNRILTDAEVWQLYAPQTRWQLYRVPSSTRAPGPSATVYTDTGLTQSAWASAASDTRRVFESGVGVGAWTGRATDTAVRPDTGLARAPGVVYATDSVQGLDTGAARGIWTTSSLDTRYAVDGGVGRGVWTASSADTQQGVDAGATTGAWSARTPDTAIRLDAGLTRGAWASVASDTAIRPDSGAARAVWASVASDSAIRPDSGQARGVWTATAADIHAMVDAGAAQGIWTARASDVGTWLDAGVAIAIWRASGAVGGVSVYMETGVSQAAWTMSALDAARLIDGAVTRAGLVLSAVDALTLIEAGATILISRASGVDTQQGIDSGLARSGAYLYAADSVQMLDSGLTQAAWMFSGEGVIPVPASWYKGPLRARIVLGGATRSAIVNDGHTGADEPS